MYASDISSSSSEFSGHTSHNEPGSGARPGIDEISQKKVWTQLTVAQLWELADSGASSSSPGVAETSESSTSAPGADEMEDHDLEFTFGTPQNASEVPSLGSVGHDVQRCNRPCTNFSRGRCMLGYECKFCHYDHKSQKPASNHKPCRSKRVQYRKLVEGLMNSVEVAPEDFQPSAVYASLPQFITSNTRLSTKLMKRLENHHQQHCAGAPSTSGLGSLPAKSSKSPAPSKFSL
jgi:hypothetical protein